MTPRDLRIAVQVERVRSLLADGARVLDVGCGDGELARRLAAAGAVVTALDPALRDPVPAHGVTYVEQDFLSFEAEPFDALVFGASLHHIVELERCVAHAARLLAPNGVIIVDDFDVASPDAATLAWYYDTQELLAVAGLFPRDRIDPGDDLLERWRHAHQHEHRLHTAAEMREAIASQLAITHEQRGPYLNWYIVGRLSDDERGLAIARHVIATEHGKIASGAIRAVGWSVVATRRR
jgi:SAM-dependent methyltransferase